MPHLSLQHNCINVLNLIHVMTGSGGSNLCHIRVGSAVISNCKNILNLAASPHEGFQQDDGAAGLHPTWEELPPSTEV